MYYWWWSGRNRKRRKKMKDQYAEEKRWVFSSDLKEESEDKCITERGREFQITGPMYWKDLSPRNRKYLSIVVVMFTSWTLRVHLVYVTVRWQMDSVRGEDCVCDRFYYTNTRAVTHSKHRFLAPSSKLCQIWLRHWRGTLYLRAAVHQRGQRLPKSLGTDKTVEAT